MSSLSYNQVQYGALSASPFDQSPIPNLIPLFLNNMEQQYKGRYQRIERIGNGTYGVIYKVKSIPEGRILIAKHIALHNIQKSKALQEFKILEKLRHHYIVRSQDSFEEDGELILIMEYCGEKDLSWHIEQRRESGKHFSEYLITNWILQMLLAVGFMHSNKIVHRDLKPQNIFVDSDMNLKVGDFGISRLLDSTGQHCQTSAGTPSYMPPQMVDSMDYSYKADIWSLGCVIYEICSLQRLFPIKDDQDRPYGLLKVMDMIKHAEIKDIPSLYSKDLNKIVRKMLTRNPEKRPQAGDILKDKLLVQLMINRINQKDNLRVQYQKGHQAASLSSTLIDRQIISVKQQMQAMGQEVALKLQGLKQKKVDRNQLMAYEKAIKQKMIEVEKAVKAAFQQLNKNGKFKDGSQTNVPNIQNSSHSLQNSSDMTIQSVQLKSGKQLQPSVDISSLGTQSVLKNSLSSSGKKSKLLNPLSNRLQSPPNLPDFETTVQSEFAATQLASLEQELTNTIQSSFQATVKEPEALAATINKLDELKNTLQKNPQAVLSNSFLDCTLSLSHDKSLPRKPKYSGVPVSGSISLQLSQSNPVDFKRKEKKQKVSQKSPEKEEESYYQADFEEYNENNEMNQRREAQLQAMLSLYQDQLARQESFNAMSQGFKHRQKYLVMSEIKEQSSEGSSIVSMREELE